MSHIIIAIATLLIGAVLVTYGVYTSFEASKRTQYTSMTNGVFSRGAPEIASIRDSLGRFPTASELDARFTTVNDTSDVIFRYGTGSNYAWLCARTRSAPEQFHNGAFDMVAEHWPTAVRGSTCNQSAGPTADYSSVTIRIY